jgi:hypothetical protein
MTIMDLEVAVREPLGRGGGKKYLKLRLAI